MRALALLLPLVVLAGCVGPPVVTPVPTPTATPVFASDEEALAAAEEAYAAYVAVADSILSEGGAQPDRLSDVATGEFLEVSLAGFKSAQTQGIHSIGRTVVKSTTLQAYYPNSGPMGLVVIYTCDDISAVDVVDASGVSVVKVDRPPQTTFAVTFDLVDGDLRISNREAWSNEPC